MMTENGRIIVNRVLSMDPEQLQQFLSSLSPDLQEHLDVLLEKAEKELDN